MEVCQNLNFLPFLAKLTLKTIQQKIPQIYKTFKLCHDFLSECSLIFVEFLRDGKSLKNPPI